MSAVKTIRKIEEMPAEEIAKMVEELEHKLTVERERADEHVADCKMAEKQIERLELDLHLEKKQNKSLLKRIVDEKTKRFAAGEYMLGQVVYWSEKAIREQSMECWQSMIDEELVVVGKCYGRLEQAGDVYYHVATKGERDGGTDEIEESDLSVMKPDEEHYRSFCS